MGEPSDAALADARDILRLASGQGPSRFVLNFGTPPADGDGAIAERVARALGITPHVGPLFEPDPELDRFRLLDLPGTGRLERADLFDVARALRAVTGADTVDPDLATDYYDSDPPAPPPGSPESADFMFWCWAPDGDRPADPDWAMAQARIPEAWAFSRAQGRPEKGRGCLVVQPDTGVVPSHEELPPHAHERPAALNLVEPGGPPIDRMRAGLNPGHGTGTGSVVASPEGGRMRGAAPGATLVPVRCVESVALVNQSPLARAIDHARRSGAHVVSISLGGVLSAALHAALRRAVAANVVVVAAAGNCVGEVVWPARYDEAIAVGGVNARRLRWRGSCRGPAVDVSGPAEFVLRADPRDAAEPNRAVGGGQGTSFATAQLAGIAALWLAHHGRDALIAALPPTGTLQALFAALVAASAAVPPGFDTGNDGAGIVDAAALLALEPAAAGAPEAAGIGPSPDSRRQVADLVERVLGPAGTEAATPALLDPQNAPEVACLMFDRLRAGRSRRAHVEAIPPFGLSAGLRRALGERSGRLTRVGGTDGR